MCAMEITIRTPCKFHKNCHETSVGFLHRSSKDGEPREDEKMCMMCEGMFAKIRQSLVSTGKWVCPVCGIIHVLIGKKISPSLSKWYGGLAISRRERVSVEK